MSIAYQVPQVMRHLSAQQVFEEGATSFLVVGVFTYLADIGKAVTADDLWSFSQTEHHDNVCEALDELEELQLIERVKVKDDPFEELTREVSA